MRSSLDSLVKHHYRSATVISGTRKTTASALTIAAQSKHVERMQLSSGGSKRSFLIYRPTAASRLLVENAAVTALPAILALHGSFSSAADMMHHTKLNRLAERENFLVVYPELGHRFTIDLTDKQADVDRQYILDLIRYLVNEENADPRRIFATGFSSGADLLHYLASIREATSCFNAFAPVCSNMDSRWAEAIDHRAPVSMIMLSGTDDKLNKWDGQPPKLLSVPETFEFWCRHNEADFREACSLAFASEVDNFKHRQTNAEPLTRMELTAAVKESTGAEVVLGKVIGGGHTWPGADQRNHLLRLICGPTHSLHSASEIIWSFFANRPIIG